MVCSDHAPDIAGLPCDRLMAPDGGEYMRRYYLAQSGDRQSRFHHILSSDPGRDMHDHPWDFVSQLLVGVYIEHTPDGIIRYEAPCVIRRKAEQLHRLELPDGPVWSYVIHGRPRREWGFMADGKWTPWGEYRDSGSIAGCGEPNPRRPAYQQRRRRRAAPRW